MKTVFKITSLVLCALMILSVFTACGENDETESQSVDQAEKQTEIRTEKQTEKLTEKETEPKTVKIACVGDSITYGVGATNINTDTYPALLGKKLGKGYDVRNFGLSGSTVINKSHYPKEHVPYIESDEYKASIKFCPDIVIIMLGTNDVGMYLGLSQLKNKFKEDYTVLINSYLEVNENAKIYIMSCPDLFKVAASAHDILTNDVHVMQRELVDSLSLELIDLYPLTEGKEELYTSDGCHPNNKGYVVISDTVYEALAPYFGIG